MAAAKKRGKGGTPASRHVNHPKTRAKSTGQPAEPAAEWVAVSDLTPWPRNPRKNDHAVAEVAESIKRFGFGAPLLARRADREVIAGHTRLKAAAVLGLERVPVRFLDLDPADAHLLALADNRLSEKADWADEELASILAEYDAEDVALAGWCDDDLAELTAGLGDTPLDEITEDEAPEPPKVPVTKPGDLWVLGEHRLVCGDCAGFTALCGDERYSLLVTDPPYGVSYAAKNEFLNAVAPANRIQTPIEHDHETPERMSELWTSWFTAIREAAAPGAAYYVTGPQGGDLLLLLLQALSQSGFPLRHMLVWVKNNHVLGRSDYHYKHEPIIYGWVEGAGHHQVENRSEVSVWEIDKPHKSDLHPTMKPVALYARAYTNSSKRGALVAEPFAGSGTAFIAAEQLSRRCYGTELDPAYCDVIVERWQNLTGGKAERKAA